MLQLCARRGCRESAAAPAYWSRTCCLSAMQRNWSFIFFCKVVPFQGWGAGRRADGCKRVRLRNVLARQKGFRATRCSYVDSERFSAKRPLRALEGEEKDLTQANHEGYQKNGHFWCLNVCLCLNDLPQTVIRRENKRILSWIWKLSRRKVSEPTFATAAMCGKAPVELSAEANVPNRGACGTCKPKNFQNVWLSNFSFSETQKPRETRVKRRERGERSRIHQRSIRTRLFVPFAVGCLNNSAWAFMYTTPADVPCML